MDMECYELTPSNDRLHFEFSSEGPKGKIRKMIKYQQILPRQFNMFNISFSDGSADGSYADDEAISNNGDRNKVLATVALSLVMFNKAHPDKKIMIIGSTAPRTRLYQMAISKYSYQFAHLFEIDGYIDGEWKTFRKGINYEAFLFKPKKLKFDVEVLLR